MTAYPAALKANGLSLSVVSFSFPPRLDIYMLLGVIIRDSGALLTSSKIISINSSLSSV